MRAYPLERQDFFWQPLWTSDPFANFFVIYCKELSEHDKGYTRGHDEDMNVSLIPAASSLVSWGSRLNTKSPTDPSSHVTAPLREFSSGSKRPVRVISCHPVE